jgi:hypothetical protein
MNKFKLGLFLVVMGSRASFGGMPLPFADTFDLYANDTSMTNLEPNGWYASDSRVKVETNTVRSGKAVVLPDVAMLSNSISSAASKVWTDFYIQPTLGIEPSVPQTNTSSFVGYVNTNGCLVVAISNGGWFVCSNQLDNTPAIPLLTNGFTRISICQDLSFNPPKFAVFIASNLVAQGLSSPANVSLYSSFSVDNQDGSAYLDDVLITLTIPPGLTSDLDGNGISDAVEIQIAGITGVMKRGTLLMFQ